MFYPRPCNSGLDAEILKDELLSNDLLIDGLLKYELLIDDVLTNANAGVLVRDTLVTATLHPIAAVSAIETLDTRIVGFPAFI